MVKRKKTRRVIKKKAPTLSTVFDCPYCNQRRCVFVKMYIHLNITFYSLKREHISFLLCKICTTSFKTKANRLTEPVDVYCEWLDESEKVNHDEEGTKEIDAILTRGI